jgi:hypothetical protein
MALIALLARRLGQFEGQAVFRRPPKLNARDALDLGQDDAEKRVPGASLVRIVDAQDGGEG